MRLDKTETQSIVHNDISDLANLIQRSAMSIETVAGGIKLARKNELFSFMPHDKAQFLFDLCSRRELQGALDAGYERGEGAHKYLVGEDDRPQVISFYVGHLADVKTQAAHMLQHYGFANRLNNSQDIRYDELNECYLPTIESPTEINLLTETSTARRLYRVEEHFDLQGDPGSISYMCPERKLQFDERSLRAESAVFAVAKRLIAEA